MIKKFFNKINKFNNTNTNTSEASFTQVGTCPKCGERILEHKDVWSCEGVLSKSCNLSIPRRTENGKEITIDMINFYYYLYQNSEMENFIKSAFEGDAAIQNNNSKQSQSEQQTNNVVEKEIEKNTQPKQSVTNTNQATVNVYQQANKSNSQESKREIFFKNGRKLTNKCSCGGDVYRYGNYAACKNCNFKIATKYAEKSFSDNEMSQLVGKRISHFTTFKAKCSNGNPLKGRVFINFDINGNLIPEYKFVNSPININGHYKEQLFAPDKDGRTEIPLSELLTNKQNNSNTVNKNNQTNTGNKNVSGDGTHVKFDPFKGNMNGNSTSNTDEYEKYLHINDSSEPF